LHRDGLVTETILGSSTSIQIWWSAICTRSPHNTLWQRLRSHIRPWKWQSYHACYSGKVWISTLKVPGCFANFHLPSLIGIGEIVLLPLDVLKIKRQTNPEAFRGRGVFRIVADEGFGLYRGWGWTAARNAPGSFAVSLI
jgi:hypothetical protein